MSNLSSLTTEDAAVPECTGMGQVSYSWYFGATVLLPPPPPPHPKHIKANFKEASKVTQLANSTTKLKGRK